MWIRTSDGGLVNTDNISNISLQGRGIYAYHPAVSDDYGHQAITVAILDSDEGAKAVFDRIATALKNGDRFLDLSTKE